MSSWNFVLSWVEHEKSFITLGPALKQSEKLPRRKSIIHQQRWIGIIIQVNYLICQSILFHKFFNVVPTYFGPTFSMWVPLCKYQPHIPSSIGLKLTPLNASIMLSARKLLVTYFMVLVWCNQDSNLHLYKSNIYAVLVKLLRRSFWMLPWF